MYGALKPRVKQLRFYSGMDSSLPTKFEYYDENDNMHYCPNGCSAHDIIRD